MSSCINIGLVASSDCDYKKIFCNLISKNFSNISKLMANYPTDESGENWVRSEISINEIFSAVEVCDKFEGSTISFDYNVNNILINDLEISIDKLEDSVCLIISIKEESLYKNIKIEKVEKYIINFLKENIEDDIKYGFCDNDAYLEYELKDILLGKKQPYSILVKKEKEKKQPYFADWKIDGFTNR